MKKLFIIVAALFVAVSFSACSDDNEGGGKAPTKMRYVKQIVRVEDGRKIEFKYDSKWRITQLINTNSNGEVETDDFIYDGNTIKTNWCKLTLNNAGYVIRMVMNDTTIEYSYNEDGGMIEERGYGDLYTYSWIDGNRYCDTYFKTTYSNHKTPKCNLDFTDEDMLDNPVGWGPDWMLLGKQSAYLPSEFIDSENDANPNRCSYKFDDKGYISEIATYGGKENYSVTYY